MHYLPPYRAESLLALAGWLGKTPEETAAGASSRLMAAVAEMRLCKEPREVEQIDWALDVSADMYEAALGAMIPGALERTSWRP